MQKTKQNKNNIKQNKTKTKTKYISNVIKFTIGRSNTSQFALRFFVQVFQIDTSDAVTSNFPELVYARIVRITCLNAEVYFVMKFEILGCKHD